jgi:hypothetical protein
MTKRAKDITLGDLLVTESGLLTVATVATDMYAGTTLVKGKGGFSLVFGPTEQVEVLD